MRIKNRTFKKHSARIAKLALEAGMIDAKFFNELYWAEYRQDRMRKKRGRKYRHCKYFTELHYWTCDYWGESDEHSLIGYVQDMLYWGNNSYDFEIGAFIEPIKYYHTTQQIINYFTHGIQQSKLHRTKTKYLRINRAKLQSKKQRSNQVLRLRKYHY